ncbi:MAG: anti-sigma factor family protein [Armatimonadota bacterium]
MDCVNCEESFSAVLEEDDSATAQSSREHLQVCPACRARYESFRQTVQHLRALPPVAPPPKLLNSIARAIDAEAAPRARWIAYWQPVTAGLSVAACLMMVLWTVVLNPVNVTSPQFSSHVTQNEYSLMRPGAPAQGSYAAAGRAANTAAATPERQTRPRNVPASYRRPSPVRGSATPFADDFGGWGQAVSAPAASPAASTANATSTATVSATSAGSGKPADSFAASGLQPDTERPVQRTSGEVQLAFTPPLERIVGSATVGQLLVTSQAEANVTIRVQPQSGLRVMNAADGVLYQGPLRKGDKLQLPMRLMASRAGTQRMRLILDADVAGVATELPLLIPMFVAAPEVEKLITFVFKETPSVRAIRELAAVAGIRVMVAEGLESQLVTYDFSAGVPVAAALRTLCDGCGYKLEQRDGVYHVEK